MHTKTIQKVPQNVKYPKIAKIARKMKVLFTLVELVISFGVGRQLCSLSKIHHILA